jgi:hypothetical protein
MVNSQSGGKDCGGSTLASSRSTQVRELLCSELLRFVVGCLLARSSRSPLVYPRQDCFLFTLCEM